MRSWVRMCATLTGISEDHWSTPANTVQCRGRIAQQFQSYLVVCDTVVYGFVLYNGVRGTQKVIAALSRRLLGTNPPRVLFLTQPRRCEEPQSQVTLSVVESD